MAGKGRKYTKVCSSPRTCLLLAPRDIGRMRRKRYTSAEVSRGRMAGGSPLHVPDVTSSLPRRLHLSHALVFPRSCRGMQFSASVGILWPRGYEGNTVLFFFFLDFSSPLPSSLFDFSYFPLGFVYLVSDINGLFFWTGLKLRIKLEECEWNGWKLDGI